MYLNKTLNIDPTKHEGLAAKKSDQNGKHDGEMITPPITREEMDPTCVYSVLIDNIHEGYATDYRLIYINGILVFFYEKKRPVNQRFSNKNELTKLRSTQGEFTTEEISLIDLFCQKLGADYGEPDVLRDKSSGEFFIVDFAKTPAGPPNGLSSREALTAIEKMSIAFINNLLLEKYEPPSLQGSEHLFWE